MTMGEYRIHDYQPHDHDQVSRLVAATPLAGRFREAMDVGYIGDLIVAERGKKIVGMAMLSRYSTREGEIKDLNIHPDFLRTRVAERLIGELEERAIDQEFVSIYTDTPITDARMVRLFRRLGYEETRRTETIGSIPGRVTFKKDLELPELEPDFSPDEVTLIKLTRRDEEGDLVQIADSRLLSDQLTSPQARQFLGPTIKELKRDEDLKKHLPREEIQDLTVTFAERQERIRAELDRLRIRTQWKSADTKDGKRYRLIVEPEHLPRLTRALRGEKLPLDTSEILPVAGSGMPTSGIIVNFGGEGATPQIDSETWNLDLVHSATEMWRKRRERRMDDSEHAEREMRRRLLEVITEIMDGTPGHNLPNYVIPKFAVRLGLALADDPYSNPDGIEDAEHIINGLVSYGVLHYVSIDGRKTLSFKRKKSETSGTKSQEARKERLKPLKETEFSDAAGILVDLAKLANIEQGKTIDALYRSTNPDADKDRFRQIVRLVQSKRLLTTEHPSRNRKAQKRNSGIFYLTSNTLKQFVKEGRSTAMRIIREAFGKEEPNLLLEIFTDQG